MDVFAELKLIMSEFQSGLVEARAEMDETEEKGSGSFSNLGKAAGVGLAAAGTAIVATGALALDLGLKFQTSTARMAAAGNIPIKTAEQIGQAFLHTGADTVYSGAQMEAAYGAVAGQLSTLKGFTDNAATATAFMNVAMDLAEESGTSLGSATSDLAKLMQAYGLSVGQARGASVDMFNASRLTGQSIDTLTQGMARLHSQMGIATPSLADASALLVDLTEHGETGRQAMSSLSSMFTGIITPTAAVTKAQEALGVSFINAKTGALDPMSQIISELGPKIDGMGSAQATATLKSLGFGAASLKLVSTIQAGPAAFQAASNAVNNASAAHAALAAQQNTVEHQMEALKVQLENTATVIGLKLIPIVHSLLAGFTVFISYVMTHHDVLIALVAVIGVMLVAAAVAWVAALSPIILTVGAVVIAVGAMIAIGVALYRNWDTILSFLRSGFGTLAQIILLGPFAMITLLALHWQEVWSGMETAVRDFVGFFEAIPGEIWNNVILPIWNFFASLPSSIVRLFQGLGSDIIKTIESDVPGGGIAGKIFSAVGLATGGLVTSPTLAVVGEAGPELVIPLSTLQGAAIDGSGITRGISGGGAVGGAAGGGDLVLQIDGQTFARMAGPAFRQWLNTAPGRNGVRLLVQ